MARSTSFRISEAAKRALDTRAAHEGESATALLESLIVEGVQQRDFPGIVFRGPPHDRRAALAAGPDVWEIIARLQDLDGGEEHRIATLSAELELHPRLIRIAVDYAAQHTEEIHNRIERNQEMVERSRSAVMGRQALLT